MNKSKLLTLLIVIVCGVMFGSCKKDEIEPTVESLLVGEWTGNEQYVDGELSEYNELFKYYIITLNEDGSGTQTLDVLSQPLQWSYDNSTEELTLEKEFVDYGDGVTGDADTLIAKIIEINDTLLSLSREYEGATIEETYIK